MELLTPEIKHALCPDLTGASFPGQANSASYRQYIAVMATY